MDKFDIGNFVERREKEYITYYAKDFERRGDLARSTEFFAQKYLNEKRKLQEKSEISQLEAFKVYCDGQQIQGKEALDLFNSALKPGELDMAMDYIANAVNEAIQSNQGYVVEEFNRILKESKSTSNQALLEKGAADGSKVVSFFNLVFEAINLSSKVPNDLLQIFADIASTYSNTTIDASAFKVKTTIGEITQEQMKMIEKILEKLSNASKKLQETGQVESSSFSSTINNIFSKDLGEYISKSIYTKATHQAADEIDNTLLNMFQGTNIKATINRNAKVTMGGSKRTNNITSTSVSKTDLYNSNGFSLQVQDNGKVYDIVMSANISVKWGKGNISSPKQIAIVNNTPFGKYFTSTTERWLGYNTIIHRFAGSANGDYHQAYRVLRASTAASFFNDWISGTGNDVIGSKVYKDKVQFIMIDGQLYSISQIIARLLDNLEGISPFAKSVDTPLNLTVSEKDGARESWHGEFGRRNLELAVERSDKQKDLMNRFLISTRFNSRILT